MSEDARHSAAIEIQRVYRGYLTRLPASHHALPILVVSISCYAI